MRRSPRLPKPATQSHTPDVNRAELAQSIERLTGFTADLQWRIVETLAVVLIVLCLRALFASVIRRTVDDPRSAYQWRKVASYVLASFALLVMTRIWFAWFDDFGTFLGLAAAGLTIALRDLIVNFAGWMFIISRRPFVVGDRVQVGQFAGDIIDQRIFSFSMLEIGNWVDADQSTGRIIHVPNGKVFTEPQANYTLGFSYIWNELPVHVTFESNWRKAHDLLQEIVNRHAEEISEAAHASMSQAHGSFMIIYSNVTPIVYTDIVENGVRLTIRYLCNPRRRRGSSDEIWEDVLDTFAQHDDIRFAYPTTRFVQLEPSAK